MKRLMGASLLMMLGLFLVLLAAGSAEAQTAGTCYVNDLERNCSSSITADMPCGECMALTFPFMSWKAPLSTTCITSAGKCAPTAVTFLNIRTPITACNASWAIPGIGLVGIVVAVGGLSMLRRGKRA